MSDEHGVALSISQLIKAWRAFCTAVPNHTEARLPGMELTFSRLPIAFFNMAFLTGPVGSSKRLRSLGNDACEWAQDKGVPWFLVVSNEMLADGISAETTLDGCGLAPMVKLTGMLAHDVAPLVEPPDGLELLAPHDDESSAAMVNVNEAAYGIGDMQAAVKTLGSHALWKNHFAAVGLRDGRPVTCSAVLMIDGCRYVGFVATHPDYQRRGYAEAAMRRSLDDAARVNGRGPSVLHATEAGRPLYQRMGYTPISTHTLFIEKKFLAGH